MKNDRNIRNLFFYLFDFLKGKKVYSNLKQIKAVTYLLNQDELKEYQNKRFDFLITEVVKNVPAYKAYCNYKSINDVPVLTKQIIKKNFNDFFSKKYNKKHLVEIKTSGSYGTPFSFYITNNRKARHQAEVIYYGQQAGYFVGQKHVYVRSCKKSKIKLWLQNQILISPSIINENHLNKYREICISKKPLALIGYPTVISNIASFCMSKGDTPKTFCVDGIITTSEPLTETARKNIEKCFGVNPQSRYSSEELGVIAQECPKCGLLHVNYPSHIVEVLKFTSNEKVKHDELGRVVVTDLFNDSFPLIRYDTGDLAKFVPAKISKCRVDCLSDLQGRAVEFIYNTNGNKITPMMINGVFRDYPDTNKIIQYQFSQESENGYILKLMVLERSINIEDVLTSLKNILGVEALIDVVFVDYIPPLKSGKRPYIINNFKKAS